QQAVGDVIGGPIRQRFIRNTDFVPLLAGHTLEGLRHWELTSRGVEDFTFDEDFFVGRDAALTELQQWLAMPEGDGRARLITGRPGSGKSAVLGRLMMARKRTEGHAPDVSVYARRLTAAQMAESLAKQLAMDKSDVTDVPKYLAEPGPPVLIV